MKLLKIDKTGLFIEDVIVEEIPQVILHGAKVNDPMYIETPYENVGFVHPKWNGSEWVEGASQEVLDEIEVKKMENLFMPLQEEVAKASREIEIIELLISLEVI